MANSIGIGNTFDHLYTGIYINGDANILNVLTDSSSRIGIYNNKFSNISNCVLTAPGIESQKVTNCYGSYLGAAVFANYGMVPAIFDALIDLRNRYDTNTVIKFDSCDKAVVLKNASLTAKNLYLSHNLLGAIRN